MAVVARHHIVALAAINHVPVVATQNYVVSDAVLRGHASRRRVLISNSTYCQKTQLLPIRFPFSFAAVIRPLSPITILLPPTTVIVSPSTADHNVMAGARVDLVAPQQSGQAR